MEKSIILIDDMLEKFSRWGIIFSLFAILTFAILSIVLRWLGMSPMWIEPLVRHLVFLSAFLGGSLATSKRVHIKVDLFTHLLNSSSTRFLFWLHRNLISLFCFITTFILTSAAYDFYLVEKEFGTSSFFNIHSSMLVGIIPLGMGLICWRFFNQLLLGVIQREVRASHRI